MVKWFARWILTAASVLSFGACAFSDAGSGTNTLMVVIDMGYNANTTDSTTVQATVKRGDLKVGNANIVLTDSDTGKNFTIDQNSVNLFDGYHRRMEVRVTAGVDTVICQLEGPSPHTVTAPLSAEQHSLHDDLKLNWTSPDGLHADQVVIIAQQSTYQTTVPNDDGWFTIPASILRPSKETVTVRRISQVTPAGGTSGSLVRSSYEVSVPFTIQ